MLQSVIAWAFGMLAFLMPQSVYAPHSLFVLLPAPQEKRAEILFAGDMMFDRTVRLTMEEKGEDYIFSCIADVLKNADVVVANLEGPITEFPSMSASSTIGSIENMTFTFPVSVAPLLARHNIKMVNLGNNHINNFGEKGMMSTMVHLSEAGVGSFGSPLQSSITRREIHGIPFEFLSYNEFMGGGDGQVVKHHLSYSRREGFVPIVYTHWGDEYATTSPERIQQLAHEFIDAGAEIVIGSHPHVIQEHEVYRGKHIYYSLGNFVFDQYWNDAVSTGLLVRVVFSPEGVVSVEDSLVKLGRDRRTCPIE